jgi:hypothetical protein
MKSIGGRRSSEFREHEKLARLLAQYIDPETTFWTSLENRPRSRLSALAQRRRHVRAGIPDVMVIFCGHVIFLELKPQSGGLPSKAQKRIRAELLQSGATWWLARGSASALRALQLSGVVFRKPWTAPRLEPHEGPFSGAEKLPSAPEEAARVRAAVRRWRERKRERKGALAAEQYQVGNVDVGAGERRGPPWPAARRRPEPGVTVTRDPPKSACTAAAASEGGNRAAGGKAALPAAARDAQARG